MVIYIDILFIVNFFINFFLLCVTARFLKQNPKILRLIISSALGGVYSFIILVQNISPLLLALSKVAAATVMLLVAFSFHRLKGFFVCFFVFAFVNLVFLGVIIGICITLKPADIVINNSVVYFNISAGVLLSCAFFAYLISCIVIRLNNRRMLKKEIYQITIFSNNSCVSLYAFLDTGNKLREPFSNSPVIIADKSKVQHLANNKTIRLIPISTVNSTSLLTAFKADKVIIKSTSSKVVLNNIYIALSDQINAKNYSAILNPDLLEV